MAGREWRPKGEPVEVEDHSFFFTGPDVEQAIPYGIYALVRDHGLPLPTEHVEVERRSSTGCSPTSPPTGEPDR